MSALLATPQPGGRLLYDETHRTHLGLPGEVRSHVRALLDNEPVPRQALDDLLSILSELVTNSCVHTMRSWVRVTLVLIDESRVLHGTVHDDGPGAIPLPVQGPRELADPARESGMGLGIVVTLSTTCETVITRTGKAVRFALDLSVYATEPTTRA
ncbi:ATP-binding protein [Yinghuangia sp. ASG 101]|uniref:ATP-binding protein n=1 Tax=Yinghuangia sp. ASG 101 TaxID=2896848 RepID=UPI001E28FEAC|nr:ATP-binding protein [Yinghuangia sp. ASG 101]UGQ14813.1 ATP-binding protein [Yinghuangia sp. ASG 101]